MKIMFDTKNKITKMLLFLSATAVWVLIVATTVCLYTADVLYNKALSTDTLNIDQAAKSINLAIRLNPYEPIYHRGAANIYISLLPYATDQNQKMNLKVLALTHMNDSLKLNPNNLATIKALVPLYYLLALNDYKSLIEPESATTDNQAPTDPNFLPIAENYYNKVSLKFPNDVGVQTLLAKYYKKLNLVESYNDQVEKVRVLRPDLLEWHESFVQ